MQVAAIGAAASLSLADADFGNTGKKEGSQFNLMTLVSGGLASGSTILWIIAFVLSSGTLALVNTVISIVVAPIVVYQRYQLSKMSTFRDVHNELRKDVMKFALENDEMELQIDALAQQADRVSKAEAHLGDIAASQGSTVNDLMNLIKVNAEIQIEMQELLKSQVMEQVMGIVIMADRDQDFNLDDGEISMLFMRLKSIQGVESINEDKLRALLHANRGVIGLMKLFRELGSDKEKMKMIQVSSRDLLQ